MINNNPKPLQNLIKLFFIQASTVLSLFVLIMARNFLMFFSAFLFLSIPVSSQLNENELYFPGFKDLSANLTLSGAAKFEKDGVLCLTNDSERLLGQAFYSLPIQFKNSTNGEVFSFSSSFALGIVPSYPNDGGHGMAFTISPSKELNDTAARHYLGLFNKTNNGNASNHLFAVEFDTVQSPEFYDIDGNHVGIDINSLISNESSTAAYIDDSSTKRELILMSGKPILAWIDYDASENLLNVTISPNSSKPRLPLLSFNVNLSPIFLESMYIGFSSSTGIVTSSHYILGWSFKINGQAGALDLSSLPSIPDKKKLTAPELLKWMGISPVIVVGLTIILVLGIFLLIRWRTFLLEADQTFSFQFPNSKVYACQLWKEGVATGLMNPTLRDSYCEDQVLRCINLALLCVEHNPMDRPIMSVVISMSTSEGVKLPMPKQPAFSIERKIVVDNASGINRTENTNNNFTISVMDPRSTGDDTATYEAAMTHLTVLLGIKL
ncbi:hypothetical protein Pint_20204 [Pistacia integerrima]|uniref:Uncharacterized protein n=1 Tax=Pistacia integerrima TaxID=434235 RepID=A0ACC0X9Q3_9ROSI|nr:hypothetical protein Pint_20204 [Pistacia integerrima]